MVLLDALVELGYRKLIVCHLNHRIRARVSASDARFVASLGKRYGLTVHTGSEGVPRLAKAEKQSLETAARLARHRFFFATAAHYRCRRIFLAHHANDQVETVLNHLFRGAGLGGLVGMRETGVLQPPSGSSARKPLEVIRPMLTVWREEIDAYAETHRLPWREDASNASHEHLRNRVRSVLLPVLNDVYQRDVTPIVHRLAEIVFEDHDYLTRVADQALAEIASPQRRLSAPKLRSLHPAIQRRVLQRWFDSLNVSGVGFSEIESARKLLASNHPSKVNLPGGRYLRRKERQLFVE